MKNVEDLFTRLDTIHEGDGQSGTDGSTDRHRTNINCMHSITRQNKCRQCRSMKRKTTEFVVLSGRKRRNRRFGAECSWNRNVLVTLNGNALNDNRMTDCHRIDVNTLKGVLQRTFFISTNERLMYKFYKTYNYFIFK